jgi:hypothetical protein
MEHEPTIRSVWDCDRIWRLGLGTALTVSYQVTIPLNGHEDDVDFVTRALPGSKRVLTHRADRAEALIKAHAREALPRNRVLRRDDCKVKLTSFRNGGGWDVIVCTLDFRMTIAVPVEEREELFERLRSLCA